MTKKIDLTNTTIKTERLTLLPIDESYVNEIFINFNHDVTRYMFPKPAKQIEETNGFISFSLEGLKNGTNLQLIIVENTTKNFIGCIGIHNLDTKNPELGIWTKISSHRNGFGLEAMTALITWARNSLDFNYLVYPVDKRNIASKRIAELNGGKIKAEYKKVNLVGFELDEVEYWIYK